MIQSMKRLVVAAVVLTASVLSGCERPPIDTVQRGFRGTGIVEVNNPRAEAKLASVNQPPVALPAASTEGPKAGQVYKNVKVLGDLSVAEFTSLMVAMTSWVAPEQGCAYCHNVQNLADDALYTKVVARKMVQMTQRINGDWKAHVADTGVTCYTCHRGNNIPQNVWFTPAEQKRAKTLLGDKDGQNAPAKSVALAALPNDPFTPFLSKGKEIRVAGAGPLPTGKGSSIQQTEQTYGLMTHMSDALGVNCTYCHNSRSFGDWSSSSPARVTAWHGIRMVRDLNNQFLDPLKAVFPQNRLGPTGDVAKADCATCHQGAFKPLYGAKMLTSHPGLASGAGQAAPAAASAAKGTKVSAEASKK